MKNNTEGECCQRRHLHLIIVKVVSVEGIHFFSVFIISGCYFSLSTKKTDILTINAPQCAAKWLYIFLTFTTTLKCLIIWFIWFLNGFKSATFVACFIHLIKEITFDYIHTIKHFFFSHSRWFYNFSPPILCFLPPISPSVDVTVVYDWRREIVNLETSKPFSFVSRSINLF